MTEVNGQMVLAEYASRTSTMRDHAKSLAEPGERTEYLQMAYDGAMSPTVLEQRIKAELHRALRARDRAAVAALRAAVGAIDNAGSVPLLEDSRTKVAGRAADVPRRELTEEEVAEIVRREVDELDAGITAAERYGRAERAGELRAGRAVLAAYTEV